MSPEIETRLDALRKITRYLPALGDPERRWLIEQLQADIGKPGPAADPRPAPAGEKPAHVAAPAQGSFRATEEEMAAAEESARGRGVPLVDEVEGRTTTMRARGGR
jgi:hypothetical protein